MKTHRIISIILGAALTASLARCSKEAVGSAEQPADQQLVEFSLSAALSVPGGDTKVKLGDNGVSPLWEDGDQILVLDANMKPVGPNGLFKIKTGTETETGPGTMTGTFIGEVYMLQTPTYAIYPESVYDPATKKFTLPAEQDGTIKSAVMLGKISQSGNAFTTEFANVCSVLKINTGAYGTGGAPAIKSVTVSAASGIAGEFTINWDNLSISPATDGTASNSVTATAASGSYTNNTDIYIPIIPTGSQTFDFDFINTEPKYASVSESFEAAANYINALGTAGGMEFKPQTLPGVFSVSATKTVQFSRGNLWADSSNVLHFEPKQWKSTPESNGSMDSNHISHFTWSSTVKGAVSGTNSGGNLFCDEGHKVPVDGSEAIFYVLSIDEWAYLFNTRTASTVSGTANARYAKAIVNGKTGVILLPNSYTHPTGVTALNHINTGDVNFTANSYDVAAWTAMETAGCVFLPAAGGRYGSDVDYVGDYGLYWSSAARDSGLANSVNFNSSYVRPNYYGSRSSGSSVRLITEKN